MPHDTKANPLNETPPLGPGPRSRVRRNPARAVYDAATVHAIVDAALVCHVAVSLDGEPVVLPTAHARVGGAVYLHGAAANRLLSHLAQGARCCLSFTLVDGLVLARSAFHHSVNYRSAVVFGAGQAVRDADEKRVALERLVDHVLPGRSAETRSPSDDELHATQVVRVDIEEASAKVRTGPPVDDADDMERPGTWAGVVPLRTQALSPVRDAALSSTVLAPATLERLHATALQGPRIVERSEPPFLFSTDKSRLDVPLIHRFLSEESYWAKGTTRERTERVIERSLCFGLYEGNAQVGNARIVSDGGRFAYLADVFVLPEYRGLGLGTRLIRFALEHPELQDVTRILLGTVDAHTFYERFGFVHAPEGRYMLRFGPGA